MSMTITEWVNLIVTIAKINLILLPICSAIIIVELARAIIAIINKIKEKKDGKNHN